MATEWIGGIHAVMSLLEQRPEDLVAIYLSQARRDEKIAALVGKAQKRGITVQMVDKQLIEQHLSGQNHQGVGAQAKVMALGDETALFAAVKKHQLAHRAIKLVILDGVTDPHNLGAILRTCDATGVGGVIVPKDNSAPVNATVHKVASGATRSVPLYQVTNLTRTLEKLKAAGVWIYGLAGEGSEPLFKTTFSGDLALVMGSEGQGLRRLTREACDFIVSIPMMGQVESLNVSVAAGVLLYETLRQAQRAAPAGG
jgi:23S rRNA (guanosine2251-2'-O)-methyltransferase